MLEKGATDVIFAMDDADFVYITHTHVLGVCVLWQ